MNLNLTPSSLLPLGLVVFGAVGMIKLGIYLAEGRIKRSENEIKRLDTTKSMTSRLKGVRERWT